MKRAPVVRVSTKPKPGAADNPEALASAITDWLLGRTNHQPTLYVP